MGGEGVAGLAGDVAGAGVVVADGVFDLSMLLAGKIDMVCWWWIDDVRAC